MRRLLPVPLLLVGVLVAGCTADSDGRRVRPVSYAPARPAAVTLDTLGKEKGVVTVGVVVTGTGARSEGGEHLGPAAGARLAQFRLGGPQRLVLQVEDDRGTDEGAAAAVDRLLRARVAGIVYASSGPHLDAAVQHAAAAGTAVLLPYETRTRVRGPGVWRTGPSGKQVASTLQALLASRDEKAPYVLTADPADELVQGVPAVRREALGVGDGLLTAAARAAAAVAAGKADAVVVSGSSVRQAEAVAGLQEHDATTPVELGPAALAPLFSARLGQLAGAGAATVSGQYFTAGLAATDASTAPGVTAFLAAVRLAAQDPGVLALRGRRTWSQDGGASADVRSHDAVLALAVAASRAGSTTPAAVRKALGGARLTADQGLAGAPLSFASTDAVADADVVALQASTRGPDLRGGVQETAPALQWFAVPRDAP